MKYMLLVYLDEENALTGPEREHCYVESAQLCQDLAQSGHYIAASPASPDVHRDQRAHPRFQTPGHRRSLRRNPRTTRAATS